MYRRLNEKSIIQKITLMPTHFIIEQKSDQNKLYTNGRSTCGILVKATISVRKR